MPSMKTLAALAALSPLSLVAACGDGDATTEPEAAQEPTEWGYEGAGAPENWAAMSSEFALCETGANQSPVNLTGAESADLPDPQFDYSSQATSIDNLGHTLQVGVEPGSTMTVNDRQYELVQFHFHTPSEHRLQGNEYPAEVHFVHRGPDDGLAVVGAFIEEGTQNEVLANIWDQLPSQPEESRDLQSVDMNIAELVPQESQYYLYSGSLTTPPCSEDVNWMVMEQPIEMSSEQIERLRSIIGTSNRPVQPLGNRELQVDT